MSVITKAMNVVYSVILMQIVGLAWAYQIEGHGINPWLALMAVTILWLANVWWRAAAANDPCDGCPHDDCATCESEHTSVTTALAKVDRDWHCESTEKGPLLVFHANDDWIKTDLYHCDLCGYEWSTANPCPEH